MKKVLLGLSALALLAASSCKKSDSNNNSTPSNTWKVGNNSYTASTVQTDTNIVYSIVATNGGANFIYFSFGSKPVAGNYRVVNALTNNSTNEVEVSAASLSGGVVPTSYEATGNDNVNATVSVNNGKIAITMPDAWAANSTTSSDSLKISANAITQP